MSQNSESPRTVEHSVRDTQERTIEEPTSSDQANTSNNKSEVASVSSLPSSPQLTPRSSFESTRSSSPSPLLPGISYTTPTFGIPSPLTPSHSNGKSPFTIDTTVNTWSSYAEEGSRFPSAKRLSVLRPIRNLDGRWPS